MILSVILAVGILAPLALFAQSTNNNNGRAGFTPVQGISLNPYLGRSANVELYFGTVIQTDLTHKSTATVRPWDEANYPSGAYPPSRLSRLLQLNAAGDPIHSSRWTATGEPGAAVTVVLPNATASHPVPVGSDGAYCTNFHWDELPSEGSGNDSGGPSTAVFSSTGALTFSIGATLNLPAGFRPIGSQTGTFQVVVHY